MNRNVLVRIDTPEPARLWTGSGDLWIPADDIEEQASLYLGGGEIIGGLDEIEQLMNGLATRLDLAVSGVTAETTRIFLEESDDLKRALVDIGVVQFDDLWQVTGVVWKASYRIDKPSVSRDASQRAIGLSMGSDDTGRSRRAGRYWTHSDQQRVSPGDLKFDHVSGINAGTSRPFGPK